MVEKTVEVTNLSKTFEGTRALNAVSITIAPGEVRALLGENGSGKSTLIKILAGFHEPDPGAEILAYGEPIPKPLHAAALRSLGWAFVHQDLGLLEDLRVIDNLHLAMLGSAAGRRIRWSRDREWAREVLARFSVEVSPHALVRDLSAADKAMVAIVRAAEVIRQAGDQGRGLLVLDEPTVYLPEDEVTRLFDLVRAVADRGIAVLLVSHQLSEVRAVADTVTVLRDGVVAVDSATSALTDEQMVHAIIGHSPAPATDQRRNGIAFDAGTPAVATVRSLSGAGVSHLSFEVRPGEILGVTGLAGSGFEEVPYLLFGATRARSGELETSDGVTSMRRMEPWRAMRLGMALIPGDRTSQGGVASLTATYNMTLPTIPRYFRRGFINRRLESGRGRELAGTYDIRPTEPGRIFGQFSGGNQQKALLAKWLETDPSLLLVHEPTQGLDVGAREQILSRLRQLARTGTSIICASSDWEQLAQICRRVLVLRRGELAAEIEGDDVSQSRLARESYLAAEAEALT